MNNKVNQRDKSFDAGIVAKIITESRKFGFKEVYYRFGERLKQSNGEKNTTKFLSERDRVYRGMDQDQLACELKLFYEGIQGVELNYKKPCHFTEKIQWLKIFDSTDEKMALADKYAVREWVAEKIGETYLVPLLGVWNTFDDIDFDLLPERFCLKTNHGSGMMVIVDNKELFDLRKAREKFQWWMKRPFWAGSIEPHYRNIPRKIIAEKYIEEMGGGLYDYKIHCFNGKPVFIQCIGDRDLTAHTGYQNHYDMEWNVLDWTFADYPDLPYDVPKPDCLNEMCYIAEILSKEFAYVRVDLYEIGRRVYFGEMTFTPSSGIYPYKDRWTEEKDLELGKMICLTEKKSF